MAYPAIAFLPVNIEAKIDILYNNLSELLLFTEDLLYWKDISELNIITYFVYNSNAIVNSNSKNLETYSDLLTNSENNNFGTKLEIIDRFINGLYDELIEVIKTNIPWDVVAEVERCWFGCNDTINEGLTTSNQAEIHIITRDIIFNSYKENIPPIPKYNIPLIHRYKVTPIRKDNFSHKRKFNTSYKNGYKLLPNRRFKLSSNRSDNTPCKRKYKSLPMNKYTVSHNQKYNISRDLNYRSQPKYPINRNINYVPGKYQIRTKLEVDLAKKIRSELFYFWDVFADVVNNLLLDKITECQYRKTVNIKPAFIDEKKSWYNNFWDTIKNHINNSKECYLINYSKENYENDSKIIELLAQDITFRDKSETALETSNDENVKGSDYSFELGTIYSKITYEDKTIEVRTDQGIAFIYIIMYYGGTEISSIQLDDVKTNAKKSSTNLLLEVESFTQSSIEKYYEGSENNDLNHKILFINEQPDNLNKDKLVIEYKKALDKYQTKLEKINSELKQYCKITQENEKYNDKEVKDAENETAKRRTEIKQLKSDMKILEAHLRDLGYNEITPMLKEINNNIGKQVKKCSKLLAEKLDGSFLQIGSRDGGKFKFNNDPKKKWTFFINHTK